MNFSGFKRFFSVTIICLSLYSQSLSAGWYIGGAYTIGVVEIPGSVFEQATPVPEPAGYTEPTSNVFLSNLGTEEFTPSVLVLKAGFDVINFIAIEGRLGSGLTEGERNSFDIPRNVDVDSLFGVFAKLHTGWDEADLYALIGYSDFTIGISSINVDGEGDYDGASYGIGADFHLSGQMYFNMEYMQYYSDDDISAVGIGAGLTAKF